MILSDSTAVTLSAVKGIAVLGGWHLLFRAIQRVLSIISCKFSRTSSL